MHAVRADDQRSVDLFSICGNNINSAIDKLDLCDSMFDTHPILVPQAVVESFEKPLAVEKQERVPMSTTLHQPDAFRSRCADDKPGLEMLLKAPDAKNMLAALVSERTFFDYDVFVGKELQERLVTTKLVQNPQSIGK